MLGEPVYSSTELKEVLEEWLILKIRDKDLIPKIEGAEIKVKEVSIA